MTNKEKYFNFLDGLRKSGVVNMFGATPYLETRFPELKKDKTARKILVEWMDTFDSRNQCDKV